MTEELIKIAPETAKEELWRKAELIWKLKGKQKDIYRHFKYNDKDIVPVLISRRFGKSFVMCVLAIEACLKEPRAVVKYACPEKGMVADIINPIIEIIIADCPEDIKPEWVDKKWRFPNGSCIQVAGCNGGRYNSLRGGYAQLCIVDESAFVEELETVVYSVLGPTTDTTEGRTYLASTPNDKNANHEFHELFVKPWEATGDLLRMTWLDSPMIDDKRRAKILSRYVGGENNIKFRCEYLCEIPNVTENTVIPEFAALEDVIVREVDKPEYCDFYTSMDIGFKDLTVALFAYYDFRLASLVVLDEYVINGPEMKTDILKREIEKHEKIHFRNSMIEQGAYLRVMDNNNLLLTNELSRGGLLFVPTAKHNKESAVDSLRQMVEQQRLIIHPRCINLIYHIKNAQWHYTRAGTYTGKFKHLAGNDDAKLLPSHADALDALIYLNRNIHHHRNPFPSNYGLPSGNSVHMSVHKREQKSEAVEFMEKILNLRKKRKKT